mgnify:CR=1 FL=1
MSDRKLIRLGKSGIEYLDYVWNLYSGCKHKEQGPGPSGAEAKCPPVPCWAEVLIHRHPEFYPDGFAPTFYPEAFLSPLGLKGKGKPLDSARGKRIGVCFMGDLFGDWVNPRKTFPIDLGYAKFDEMLYVTIKNTILKCPRHTFIFLTKNPAGLKAWSPFPDNCHVGFSAWSPESFIEGLRCITQVEAKVKWVSLEPMLDWSEQVAGNAWELLDWVAIGALTGTKKQMMALAPKYPALTPWKLSAKGNRWGLMPPVAWLKNIVGQLDAAGTKVFIKDNLYTWLMEIPHEDLFWEDMSNLRQEFGARESKKASAPDGGSQ